ncbi:hypothetical protein NFHSH190041_34290 [Shewanella sp. NFH-SH190041]|uniref:RICIN domain-containing protein n=1 Tax=Shewanella sp. NFH-SH190041 TaxID=2950245 RepID=UPI0021C3F193|nr:RICIN domain-containing protein [Shewanella sp. NFH-SH190041]BDM65977.1 hypothetical protein NFHSH190041_34290 [Shewanella sp. NFH-SH190041]
MFDLKNIRRLLGAIVLLVCATLPQASASSYPQKVDKALDSNFEVALRNGYSYCVAPYLAKDNIYYAYETARKDSTDCIGYDWRYDVHGHISTVITTEGDQPDNFYLCMTDVASSDTSIYSYIQLKPCSVNNARQIWKYNDSSQQMVNQHTGNRLQEINWYLATSAKSSNLYDLKVTGRQILFALVPAPLTLAYQFNFHYSFEGKSYTRILGKDGRISDGPLRYDPQTRQISKVMPDGYQYCLRSNMLGTTTDSEFVSFQRCPDSYGDGIVPNPLKWTIRASVSAQSHGREFPLFIEDIKGNLFGVERSGGINIGTGYTIKPKAVSQIPDRFKPLYRFQDGGETLGRQSYRWGNYLGSLQQQICPAPGVFADAPDNRAQRRLPDDFDLSRWLRRLYQISTHPGGPETSGPCGTCLLHSAEMALEMHRHGNHPPAEDVSPQFFALDAGQTSVNSFVQRFPGYAAQFQQLMGPIVSGTFDAQDHARDEVLYLQYLSTGVLSSLFGGSGLSMTPSIYFNAARRLGNADVQAMLNHMRGSPVGTMFIVANSIWNQQAGQEVSHASMLIRTPDGLHAVPTSESSQYSFNLFSQLVNANINSVDGLSAVLRNYRPQRFLYMTEAVVITLSPEAQAATPAESFDLDMLSVGNCTIGGAVGGQPDTEHGAGSGLSFTVPENLFQCVGGRCDTSSTQASANGDDNFQPHWPGQCELLEWVRGKWDWNGGAYWAKRLNTAPRCRAANRCRQGGACFRWSETRDIGQCEHLWRNSKGQWQWFAYGYFTREKACRDANQCNGYGPCFRWNDGRP